MSAKKTKKTKIKRKFKALGIYERDYQIIDLIADNYGLGKAEFMHELVETLRIEKYCHIFKMAAINLANKKSRRLGIGEPNRWYYLKKKIIIDNRIKKKVDKKQTEEK